MFGIWVERELANQPFNLGAWIGKFISGDLGFEFLQPSLHLRHFPQQFRILGGRSVCLCQGFLDVL